MALASAPGDHDQRAERRREEERRSGCARGRTHTGKRGNSGAARSVRESSTLRRPVGVHDRSAWKGLRPCNAAVGPERRVLCAPRRKCAREDSNLRPAVSAIRRLLDGPDHLFVLVTTRTPGASTRRLVRRAYAGVSPGRLTRWSLHLPSAARFDRIPDLVRTPPTARLGIALAFEREGFPEFTRFASTRRRAGPLFFAHTAGRCARS